MHAFGASLWRQTSAGRRRHQFLFSLTRALLMSGPQRIASALNRWARAGIDQMGGADGEALDRLLDEFFGEEEGSHPLPGCML